MASASPCSMACMKRSASANMAGSVIMAAIPSAADAIVASGREESYMTAMTVVIDRAEPPRHPEKAHRPDSPVLRKPEWIRVKAPVSREYAQTREIVRAHKLHTVCEEAACPNIGECWTHRHADDDLRGHLHARLRLLQRQDGPAHGA